MKQNLLVCFLLLFALLGIAHAQEKIITGKVTDQSDGSPIAGASVLVPNTTIGTQSDGQGRYSFKVPANASAIVVRYIGYLSKTVSLEGKNVIDVSLSSDASELSEVVVTGYGTQKRKDLTGSISTVKGENLQNVAIPSIDKFLQGQVAGVQASTASGVLGQPAKIRIRGTNSISSSSDPLYVIDGVPYITGSQSGVTPSNPLGDINPNDIANIEILKDGSATAIYGSRASNGVILITTKSGVSGSKKFSYDNWFGIANPSKRYELMNAEQFMEITNEKLTNVSEPAAALPMENPAGGIYDTDWQGVIYRTGFQQNHGLSLSGGNNGTTYYASLGFTDQKGIIDANSLRRYTARLKVDQKGFNDRLTVGINAAISHTTNKGLNTGTNALSGNVLAALYALPNVPAVFPDGTYNISSAGLGQGNNLIPIVSNYTNQRYVLDHNINDNTLLNITGDAYADVEIIKNLHAKTQIGINLLNSEDYQYWDRYHGDGRGYDGLIYQQFLPRFRYNWQNTLTYDNSFGKHHINLLAGQEFQKSKIRSFSAEGRGLSADYFGENGNIIDNTLTNQFIGGNATEQALESYFGRVQYSFHDRYLLTASLRHDLISSLPWSNQGATLPGASIGWRLSEEDFFNASWINDMKIRGGYAKVGNVDIGSYPYAGNFSPVQYGSNSGIRFSQAGNDQLSFETSKKYNVGLDATLFKDRLSFTADYFVNNIDNMILAVPTPSSLGIPGNSINQNVGNMTNKGLELTINATIIDKNDFTWNASFNTTFQTNKVKTLVNGQPLAYSYHITQEGESIASFFGFDWKGVNSENGNPIYEKIDENGSPFLVQQLVGTTSFALYDPSNPTDVSQSTSGLGVRDKRILGNTMPKWFGGFNNSFRYKNIDLNIFLTFSGGNYIYNQTRQDILLNQQFGNGGTDLMNRWNTPGQITDIPKLAYGYGSSIYQTGNATSQFVEKADFLRAQNIGLGYNFPKELLSSIHITNLRVFAQVQNAFVITGYKGADPELASLSTTNSTENTQPNRDIATNLVPRTFTFGLNVGF